VLLVFLPAVKDDSLLPVNVLRMDGGDVGLGAARVPQQLVVVAPFLICLARNNPSVLFPRDSMPVISPASRSIVLPFVSRHHVRWI
jgi:excinuclease UvrABC nuclease subunit